MTKQSSPIKITKTEVFPGCKAVYIIARSGKKRREFVVDLPGDDFEPRGVVWEVPAEPNEDFCDRRIGRKNPIFEPLMLTAMKRAARIK